MNEKAKYWVEIAKYDMETAKAMFRARRYLYVGFMCHQAIEKALKAVVSKDCGEGEIPPKTHHLLKLADMTGLYDKMSDDQRNVIKGLNPMNIEARYPEYKDQVMTGLSKEICKQLLAQTEELLCWIITQL